MIRFLIMLFVVLAFSDKSIAQVGPLTGTYKLNTQNEDNELRIFELGNGNIRLEFLATSRYIRPEMDEDHYRSDKIRGDVALKGNKVLLVWPDDENCILLFSFSKDRVTIEDLGEGGGLCGFQKVFVEGIYRRTNRQKPRFETQ